MWFLSCSWSDGTSDGTCRPGLETSVHGKEDNDDDGDGGAEFADFASATLMAALGLNFGRSTKTMVRLIEN